MGGAGLLLEAQFSREESGSQVLEKVINTGA